MRYIALALLSISSTLNLFADEAVCPRCEEIREYNAAHHQNYEYYEDYLKGQFCPQSSIKRADKI